MSAENAQAALITKLAAAWPPEKWRDVSVLVAVSGGADSVALARGLNQLRVAGEGRLVLAHYNHRLRGEESDADQHFVEALANELGSEAIVEAASASSPASEASLRDLRYAFFKRAADQSGARYVATGHTADDQVETVLFNILRGTGLAGLAGIPRVRELTEAATILRPLLDTTRMEVLEFLMKSGAPFREDSTNASTNYTRNRIRHDLLPQLERDYNPQVRDAIRRLSQIAGEADDLVDAAVRRLLSNIKRLVPGGVELQTRPLLHGSELVARAALMQAWKWENWPLAEMSFEKWDELLAFAREPAPSGETHVCPRMFPGGIRAEKQGGVLRLTRPGGGTDL